MKAVTILFNEMNKYQDSAVFDGKSSFELCRNFFLQSEFLPENVEYAGVEYISASDCFDTKCLFEQMSKIIQEKQADFIIFAYADLPFINLNLTKKLLNTHLNYKCEYTFADGFSYGFAPELIDAGACKILLHLAQTTQAAEGNRPCCRESIYNLIKTDINSFEVETELSDYDWRLLRFSFCCKNKDSFAQCEQLYKLFKKDFSDISIDCCDCEQLTKIASESSLVLKTVPGFYDIQIADYSDVDCIYSPYKQAYKQKFGIEPCEAKTLMDYKKFSALIKEIALFSENAVVSLSAYGEALVHPDLLKFIEEVLSYEGLSVYLETSGLCITDDFCSEISKLVENAKARTNGWQKIMIAVRLDAFTKETYFKMNGIKNPSNQFDSAIIAVKKLCAVIPGCVYPQFTRTNHNEEELENFFRYWNEPGNESKGQLIIQKYNDCGGLLPPCKPADLSPIDRNVCWHLRRDMIILSNGDAVICRAGVLGKNGKFGKTQALLGNVFETSVKEIWEKTESILEEHIKNNYCEVCGKCDEYYTFQF